MWVSYRRLIVLVGFFILIFAGLLLQLIYLQIIEAGNLAKKAVRQRTSELVLDDGRGDILDRSGLPLTGAEKKQVLVVFPSFLEVDNDHHSILTALSDVKEPGSTEHTEPFIAAGNIDYDRLVEKQIPGLLIAEKYDRYSNEVWASHLLGHLGPRDREGKIGLEYVFNEKLSPERPNSLAAIVDGKNRLIEGIGYRYRSDTRRYGPSNLILSVDLEIQKIMEEVMDNRMVQGAAVVMDPHQGDILAMASRPNYNPDEISSYLNFQNDYQEYLSLDPFINRAILSYSPGSIFKLVVAAAALETNTVSLFENFTCPGYIEVGSDTFRCSNHAGHGEITFAEGFAYSCNTVFIETALKLGRETLYKYAMKLGLGQKTGVPLGSKREGGEVPGFITSPQEMPFLGDLALMALGQGAMEATPLQVARLTSIIAGGGSNVYPRLVQSINTRQGDELQRFPAPRLTDQLLSPSVVQQLKFMMMGVTTYGTGQEAFSENFPVGGKTGTAETGRMINGRDETYSWFTGIAPINSSPQVVITVFIEKAIDDTIAAAVFQEISKNIMKSLDRE